MKTSMLWVVLALSISTLSAQPHGPREPLGPASRATGLVISEIFYGELSCCVEDDDDDGGTACWHPGEFIEIYNSNPYFENLGGLQFAGVISYRFPEGATIPGNSFLVVSNGQYSGSLTGCEGVRLLDKSGAVLAQVTYTNAPPWPLADGTGHSIVLNRPSYGQNTPKAWSLSDQRGGSPGAHELVVSRASDAVRINEYGLATEIQYYIELYNHSNDEVDLSGFRLFSNGQSSLIPTGTIIAARGFFIFHVQRLTGPIWLKTPDENHIVDAAWPEIYQGRYPDGTGAFTRLIRTSFGAPNRPPLRGPVVINEIMYAPISGNDDDEYIELYNRGEYAWTVGGTMAGGIDYTIPTGAVIGPSNYLVVAKNPQRLLAHYPHLVSSNVLGPFSGDLDDNGERIAFIYFNTLDEVTYGVGGQWGEWSRGGGSSLELKDPDSDGRYAHNWADSDETGKGMWTTIERTANIGETLAFNPPTSSLHIFLLGAGECLVDEVEVRNAHGTGPNLLNTNPGFEAGLTGWTLQGSHDHSVLAQEGFAGSRSLRLRAATVGDNGPNRVRSSVLSAAPSGQVLLRMRVKWLRGSPEIALRVHGGGWEASGRMQIQPNGTPGQRNSRAVANAGPAIAEVSHHPPLPAANEPVRVTAMMSDPDGLLTMALRVRIEPSPTYVSIPMLDNGTAGDEIAEDGIFTAMVPGQLAGVRAGFYLEGTDLLGAVSTFPQNVFPTPPYDRVFPTDALKRECIVRWGEADVTGAFATYHLWLSLSNTARWSNRAPVLNDTPLDGTFVYNNSRVIYNVRPAYHSSPWHRSLRTTGPDGVQAIDYAVSFPPDDPFLGATEALWIHPGNLNAGTTIFSTDNSAQAEAAANTILKASGLQGNYQRYVHVIVNGSRRSMNNNQPFIMQDAQRPNVEMMQQWSPGDRGGDLVWLEDWFEWLDDGDSFLANNDADLTRREVALHPSGKAFHMGAYRFMFRPADTRPGKTRNDHSTLFAVLNTVSPTITNDAPIRLSAIEPVLDYRQWMRMLATQHAFGNWDAYGYDRGRNAYLYRGSGGRVQLWAWRNNFTLGVGGHGANTDLFGTTDPRIMQMWREPTILRAYWQGFYDLINGPFRNAYMDPIIDARVAALRTNGVVISGAMETIVKNFIRDRRNYLGGRLQTVTNLALTAIAASTNGNVLTVRGIAPIQVHHVFINGVSYPITWLGGGNNFLPPTNWTAKVVLMPGLNDFTIAGYDANHELVTAIMTVHAQYDGPAADPRENVVLSEIMYRPTQPAEYVELFNKSPNLSFNLTDWKLDGLDFVFPPGSILGPNQFLVLAADPYSLGAAFSVLSDVYRYSGSLDDSGETLSLLLPNNQGVVDRVRYESVPPWPQGANGLGSSLQVIDIDEDNSRVSNWTDGFGWRYISYTGTVQGNANPAFRGTNVLVFLSSSGTVYMDDIVLVRGAVPEAGPNVIANGDFESPIEGTWTTLGNHSGSMRTAETSHNGSASLKIVSTGVGSANFNYVRQVIPGNTTSEVYTLSFWIRRAAEDAPSILFTRTAPGSLLQVATGLTPPLATPGQSNSISTDLAPYDPIWLNEISVAGSQPWAELYNSGTSTVFLGNYAIAGIPGFGTQSLADQPGVAPGEFRVIPLPGQPGPGSYALWRTMGTHKQVVDYFNFGSELYGAVPDGQPFTRVDLRYPTKGFSNLSPRIESIQAFSGIVYLRLQVYPGHRYLVEYTSDLNSPWQPLGDYIEAEMPEYLIADSNPGTGQRFYRMGYINALEP